MAPQLNEADYQILISCMKNSSTKLTPDFDKVAEECGLKDGKAAYMRHWSTMKKLGLTGTRPQARKKKEPAALGGKRGAAVLVEGGTTGTEEAQGDGKGHNDEVPVEPETPKKKAKRT